MSPLRRIGPLGGSGTPRLQKKCHGSQAGYRIMKEIPRTDELPLSIRSNWICLYAQPGTLPSRLADANRAESGDQATCQKSFLRPCRTARHSPFLASQRRMVASNKHAGTLIEIEMEFGRGCYRARSWRKHFRFPGAVVLFGYKQGCLCYWLGLWGRRGAPATVFGVAGLALVRRRCADRVGDPWRAWLRLVLRASGFGW